MLTHPITAGVPESEADAVAALEDARAAGGEFLLVPDEGAWWFAAYPLLGRHIARHYRRVARVRGLARIWDLRRRPRLGGWWRPQARRGLR
jgi:hypothetical protein